MPRRNAFTLVELLVVVAIIVALLAILMPSLGRSIQTAHVAVCGSNLRQTGSMTLAYAADHAGGLIPYHISGDSFSALKFDEPWKGYLCYRNAVTSGGKMTPFNLAIGYELGYTGDWRVFYCPDQRAAWHDPKSWGEPWGTDTGAQDHIRAAYDYNPYPVIGGDGHRFRSLAAFPTDKPLALDVLSFDLPNASDAIAHDWAPGWNVLTIDGAVRFKVSPDARQYKFAYPFGPTDVGHSETRYDEAVEILIRS